MNRFFKRNVWLGGASMLGLLLFVALNYAPLLAGEVPEATRHVVDRAGAEAAAIAFVRDKFGDDAELKAFGMYAAERDAFGYLYKEGTIDAFIERHGDRLPLEMYRVEVKTADGDVHFVDVNPYTGRPTEWQLASDGRPIDLAALERVAEETIRELGLSGVAPTAVWHDESYGEIGYALDGIDASEAQAELVVRADSFGATGATVRWTVPEAYAATVERHDFWASALGTVGLALSGALQLAALIYALAQLKRVTFARGVVMAVAFAVIYCAINLNMYPAWKATVLGIADGGDADYLFSSEEAGGLIAALLSVLTTANLLTLSMAIGLYFCTVAGDALSRGQGWRGLWPAPSETVYGPHVMASMWKGYLFAPVMLGLQSVIYIGAENGFRTWYTIDALMASNNMMVPLLLPALAWCAAIAEEAVYRLFAIPALKKLLRFTFPAVLLSSMIWALGHVQYPIYPFYTRFVEVTLIGFLFAYIFLKHGFLTAVFAHAIVDTIWMGISITANTPSAASWTAFALYMLAPILIAAAVRWRHRRRPPIVPSGPEPA